MKSKVETILIHEKNIPQGLEVPLRLKSFCELQTGIFSTLQRLRLKFPSARIYYTHDSPVFEKSFLKRNNFVHPFENQKIDLEIHPQGFLPWEMIRQINKQIEEDLELFKETEKWKNKIKKE